jgi:hypothetical protein
MRQEPTREEGFKGKAREALNIELNKSFSENNDKN